MPGPDERDANKAQREQDRELAKAERATRKQERQAARDRGEAVPPDPDLDNDDDDLPHMGDQMIGTITALNYSASHNSAMNKAYVAAFKKANNGLRPNFISVGGHDGMHLIYEALKKTNGSTNGANLIEAVAYDSSGNSARARVTVYARR